MELTIRNVAKNYGSKKAINDINLILKPGITGLLGPNGAGKSTLMRIISTIEKPTKGYITWNGIDIAKYPNALRKNLGYLPQDFGVYPNINPVEFLEYMAALKGLNLKSARSRIDELLDILNLSNDRKRLIGEFSGGMKQRVGIAQSLLSDPLLLIVDEPTVGLDPQERIRLRNLLSTLSSNRIVVLSTHIVTDIESIAPNIAILLKGSLVTHTTPENLIQNTNGKVWDSVIPTSQLHDFQKRFIVSNSIHHSDGIHARVVSDIRPTPNSTPASPSLEDAYLHTITSLGVNL